ncbi:MAG: hypothetical protein ACE5I5_18780, partial [Candidatus Heimdallarchaeota archaeon]
MMVLSLGLVSCEGFVDGVDPLINQVEDDLLNNESQLEFLITGVQGKFGRSGEFEGAPHIIWRIAGYSDEMVHGMFDSAPDHFTYVQDGPPDLDFYEGDWDNYHTTRFLADNLIQRVEELDATGGISDQALKERALWWGNFVGGLMRMYLADHWGARALEGNTPGATVTTKEQLDNGEFGAFYSSAELHEQARNMFNAAIGLDPGDIPNPDKVLWSFIARTYLFDGMDAEAKSAAEKGLQQGDEPFTIPHTARFENVMWLQSGRNNAVLFNAHPRFVQYVLDDRKEGEIVSELTQDDIDGGIVTRSLRGPEGEEGEPGHRDTVDPRAGFANPNERLPLWEKKIIRSPYGPINPATRWAEFREGAGYTQDIYPNRDDPFPLIDWREMELILAEVAINAGDNATGLMHINNVRVYHGLDPYTLDQMLAYDNP